MVNKNFMNKRTNSIWNVINNKPKYFTSPIPSQRSFFGFKAVRLNTPTNVRNIPRRNLTWNQASIRFPRLKAFGDADHDGVLNAWDCKPFNRKRHGEFGVTEPEELMTGEILDPYYEEVGEVQQAPTPVIMTPAPQTFSALARKIPRTHKWARPGVYNEGDYLESEQAIDEYVGSGSGSALPVRGFNPGTGGGNKYG